MSSVQTTESQGAKRLYKSSARSCNVILPDGVTLNFRMGMYSTADEGVIKYLDRQIAKNGFGGSIYIDPNARTITEEQENPMLALRKKIIAEYVAEQNAFLNPGNDMGTSDQGKLKPASTSDIAPVAASGDSTARLIPVAAKLGQAASK
jgi:hypothetical protein